MKEVTEDNYFLGLRDLSNERNPHAMVGESFDDDELDFEEVSEPED